MTELSLHILDIMQNSVVAGATLIQTEVSVDTKQDRLTISIEDNGRGMTDEIKRTVLDPFTTTRTTRKVGLGLSMFKATAELCEGGLTLESELGVGTKVQVEFKLSHIDRPPMGELGETIATQAMSYPDIDFVLGYELDGEREAFDTREIRQQLGEDVPLSTPDVVDWMRGYLEDIIKSKT